MGNPKPYRAARTSRVVDSEFRGLGVSGFRFRELGLLLLDSEFRGFGDPGFGVWGIRVFAL